MHHHLYMAAASATAFLALVSVFAGRYDWTGLLVSASLVFLLAGLTTRRIES